MKNSSTIGGEFAKGIWRENPVMVSMLGLCPTLAVTNSAINALFMGGATFGVLVASSFMISLIRNVVPKQVRIAVFILIIATFVSLVDRFFLAWFPEISKALGPYIPLIIVNCIILGRAESFASRNGPFRSLLDAAGMGVGALLVLLVMGMIRELLGTGNLFNVPLTGGMITPWIVMILPPGAFLTLGGLIFLGKWFEEGKSR